MIAMTLAQVAGATSGTVHDAAADEVVVTGPATVDSREAEPGGLFAAFVGEQVDGHDYAAAAVGAGAAAVLSSRPVGVPAVVVDDPQVALGRLARHVLGRLPDCRVLAVTGSQGKTSTKDLLAGVLADAAPTVATRGSFNNELGLPLTVLRATPETRHLLLEMGARGAGHLRTLCAIARPDVSLVLNVGKAHLGEFGSREAIAAAKGELVEALLADGVAVLNADDPLVAGMAARTSARVLTFGTGEDSDVRLSGLRLDGGGRPSFDLSHEATRASIRLAVVGEHQALNAAAAAAAALAAGIPLADSARSLERVRQLSRWRMEVDERPDGVTVVNDAYNANPDSTAAALRALVAIGRGTPDGEAGDHDTGPAPRRTVAVLGEMRELGEESAAEHHAVGALAVELGVDRVVVVGDAARGVYDGARAAGLEKGAAVLVADNDEAVAWLERQVRPRDVVLVKASRGARLDVVARAVLQEGAR